MTERDGNGRLKVNWVSVGVVLVGWIASALLAYGAVDARIQVLEDRYDRILIELSELRRDVKDLLRK